MKKTLLGILILLMLPITLTPAFAAQEETWVQNESIGAYIPMYAPDETNPYPTYYQGPWRGVASLFVLRFDLKGLPQGVTITSAKLELFCTRLLGIDRKDNKLVYDRITESWDETKVTANTQPKTAINDAIYADFPTVAMQPYVVDLTPFVQGWYKGAFPNYGMLGRSQAVRPAETLNAGFVNSSNEKVQYRPKLTVTYLK